MPFIDTSWHEYLDLVFFFKAFTAMISLSRNIIAVYWSNKNYVSANVNFISFCQRKCRTTFNSSFFPSSTQTWNALPEHQPRAQALCSGLGTRLPEHLRPDTLYHSMQQITFELLFHILTLISCYLVDDPRTWRTVCLKCNIDRSACHSTINLLILITVTVVLLRFDDFFPMSPL